MAGTALVAQLAYPGVTRWLNAARPGAVGIFQCHNGSEARTIAREGVIYLPEDYSTREEWPLVIFLHGSGERGHDPSRLRHKYSVFSVIPEQIPLDAVVAAPQCLEGHYWQADDVLHFVDRIADSYRIDPKRVSLIGYSMGSYGVWSVAASDPDRFAAIVAIAGGGDTALAERAAETPSWMFHGEQDQVVSVVESKAMAKALREAGGSPKLSLLPSGGHFICREVVSSSQLWGWLLEQAK
ncbi:MAG: alpha/beta fold hydrolase [Pseudomonadota bacterium]